jgi:hypothetical protein
VSSSQTAPQLPGKFTLGLKIIRDMHFHQILDVNMCNEQDYSKAGTKQLRATASNSTVFHYSGITCQMHFNQNNFKISMVRDEAPLVT